ncbi:MAG: hypothetical protein KDH96_07255 [Candidatus Riesia sp.]|nr:hypothetical protein [Candidatus Riesia sp.]
MLTLDEYLQYVDLHRKVMDRFLRLEKEYSRKGFGLYYKNEDDLEGYAVSRCVDSESLEVILLGQEGYSEIALPSRYLWTDDPEVELAALVEKDIESKKRIEAKKQAALEKAKHELEEQERAEYARLHAIYGKEENGCST